MKKLVYSMILAIAGLFAACEKDTEPSNFAPKLTVNDATDVYRSEATLSGKVERTGGCKIAECGILYSISKGMELCDTSTADGVSEGDFTVHLTDLESGTTYYYCAYASSGYSIVKGETKSFQTQEITKPVFGQVRIGNATATSVDVSAVLEDDGGNLLEAGFVYKQVDSEEEKSFEYDGGSEDVKPLICNIETQGRLSATIKDLVPGRMYGIRPYGISSVGKGYGDAVFVTTETTSLPELSSCTLIDITETMVAVSARILSEGTSPVTERGFCYSTETEEPKRESNHFLPDEGTSADMLVVLPNLRSQATYYIRAYAKNGEGENYGEAIGYVVPEHSVSVLEVETSEATDITVSSAKIYGRVSASNATVKSCGFCWSTENMTPDIEKSFRYEMSTNAENFSTVLIGLAFGRTYYFRAYAINEKDEVFYGNVRSFVTTDIQFPSVSTSQASDITETSARIAGTVTSDGNGTVTSKGFCWSTTNSTPTVEDAMHEVEGEGTTFATVITGLVPGQTYYVRFYAVNEKGIAYGQVMEFTTVKTDAPALSATTVTEITKSSARASSSVTSDGGADITEKGFCISGTNDAPTTADRKIAVTTATDAFNTVIDGLTADTRYYIRSYATNKNGTSYGATNSFYTSKNIVAPSFSSITTSDITLHSFKASVSITDTGNGTISELGFCMIKGNGTPTIDNDIPYSTQNATSVSAIIEQLEDGTLYTLRAFARNESGIAYSEPIVVTTAKTNPPTLAATTVTEITKTSARATSSVVINGGADITEKGFCISGTNNAPMTTADRKIAVTTATDAFNTVIDGLTADTRYYIRSYATNKNGTSYGATKIFYTSKNIVAPSLGNITISNVTSNSFKASASVTDTGNGTISEMGFCMIKGNGTPTIDNDIPYSTQNATSVSYVIEQLEAGTLYTLRAFARNESGIAYSEPIVITTEKPNPTTEDMIFPDTN